MGDDVRRVSAWRGDSLPVVLAAWYWYNRGRFQSESCRSQDRTAMTPDEFQKRIVPTVVAAWERKCFCRSPGFRKLASFNFEDYGIGPVALVDSEILIQEIIRGRCTRDGEPTNDGHGTTFQAYRCPRCGARCRETYAEYSISMYRSFVLFDNAPKTASSGVYLVGFYGFTQADFAKVHDFRPTSDEAEFMNTLSNRRAAGGK